jgi:general secretion pathway protein K
MRTSPRPPAKGSALLAVLWLSAALAAIAFSLSSTVRGETERASTAMDGARAYYLASGAIERASMELLWSASSPLDRRLIPTGAAHVDYTFPGGAVRVDIVPETAKLNVNLAPPEDLYHLCLALGLDADRAHDIAAAIAEWRSPDMGLTGLDAYYLSLTPSFRPPHASFQMTEELLLVKGITPDIYYGTYAPALQSGAEAAAEGSPRLLPRPGLADCLSVYGSGATVDANTAQPAVLAAVGLPPDAIAALVARRNAAPLQPADLQAFMESMGPSANRLRLGGNSIFTFRATARPRLANGRLSDLRRTLAAQIKYMSKGDDTIQVLRWYGAPWSN